jgi:hypothetical protein
MLQKKPLQNRRYWSRLGHTGDGDCHAIWTCLASDVLTVAFSKTRFGRQFIPESMKIAIGDRD